MSISLSFFDMMALCVDAIDMTDFVKEAPMLILTRRVGETLRIGDETQIAVLGVKGEQVRIGIAAPKDTPVHRQEIYERIQAQAARTTPAEAPPDLQPRTVSERRAAFLTRKPTS